MLGLLWSWWGALWPNLAASVLWTLPALAWHHRRLAARLDKRTSELARGSVGAMPDDTAPPVRTCCDCGGQGPGVTWYPLYAAWLCDPCCEARQAARLGRG